MVKERVNRKNAASRRAHKPEIKHAEPQPRQAQNLRSMLDSYLPAGSPERRVVKIAAAAGGALIAAAVLGVGPVALAGAAGYLVYRETHR